MTEGSYLTVGSVLVKGNHKDFDWLDAQPDREVLPNLFYLPNGRTMELGEGRDVVRIGGIGGCYGPADYGRKSKQLRGPEKAHYTRDELDALHTVDLLLLHDAPAGVRFDGYVSEAAGLAELVDRLRPRLCFFGHHHAKVDADIAGVRCIGLNLVGREANLVAFDFDPRHHTWSLLGEA